MSIRTVVRSAAGAALLVNAVPHGVSGVQGRPFPSPFGNPPGVGMSSPPVNVAWSAANAIAGALLLRGGVRSPAEATGAAVGAVTMAIVISYHFSDVLAGGKGLLGIRQERRAKGGSRAPRSLVKATEPIANALAGRRGFPLWALIHHRGRKSGTQYQTPVAIIPTIDPNLVLIGLPWGPKTNWARNTVAAGIADLTWKGARQSVTSPRIIDPAAAAALARPLFRPIVNRMPAALILRRSPPSQSAER
ncbi:nitroreductase family deazaflavin-dependent oxidoreductase [uncultured Microbacterium sp.]|uniref:nitroreductase family deazaflavin-dependent oxidoreductase n=1 Tax=uncultured Microbacterium sp. TaxID=191216 RepID=UPI0028D85B62|nr:nitroreductase family deazaflavin-dependent oxidoreductase [uncultured Microbacterium sp.]